MWSLSDANVEILLAVLPLALFMFLLTFFGGQYCVPTLRLHKKQLRFVVTVCFIGCVFGLLYYHYEPPDGLDEGWKKKRKFLHLCERWSRPRNCEKQCLEERSDG
jgi:hypothetical protein